MVPLGFGKSTGRAGNHAQLWLLHFGSLTSSPVLSIPTGTIPDRASLFQYWIVATVGP